MYKKHYSKFIDAHKNKLHFAAHSHHFWPDVTLDAINQAWHDSARLADRKWSYIFDTIIGESKRHIARHLKIDKENNIAFAPNTHELVCRVISSIDPDTNIKILTTDSEFYSVSRQLSRMEELKNIEVTRVTTKDFSTFNQRFVQQAKSEDYNIIIFSHVFFNTGLAVKDLNSLVNELHDLCSFLLIDGYHAFAALPVDLNEIQNKAFYLGGGYKYAQSGEGICFMTVPDNCTARPVNTGWFASFNILDQSKAEARVSYANDGSRFAGATSDPTCFYRFNAVMNLLETLNLSIKDVHNYVQSLQLHFLDKLSKSDNKYLNLQNLVCDDLNQIGHFLTFKFKQAQNYARELELKGILVDAREDKLRVGFGMYQDKSDIDNFFRIVEDAC